MASTVVWCSGCTGCGAPMSSIGAPNDEPRPNWALCPVPAVAPDGGIHRVRPDGRIDIDALAAWPDRAVEPPPLTRDEIARACAIEAACGQWPWPTPDGGGDAGLDGDAPDAGSGPIGDQDGGWGFPSGAAFDAAICAAGADSGGSWAEVRAVPDYHDGARWAWHVRALLASGNGCDRPAPSESRMPAETICQEDGCYWADPTPHAFTCDGDRMRWGDVPTYRDCSRAFAHCDPGSETGCTDRHLVQCDPAARDRCDGDVKLGCDSCGYVSFHDCSRLPGGHCVEAAGGASCEGDVASDAACAYTEIGCEGDALRLCVLGVSTIVDCKGLGFAGCAAGACIAN